ncbi:MAG TPA: hypothetical protein VF195_10805 [Actinomycetota bacterium]
MTPSSYEAALDLFGRRADREDATSAPDGTGSLFATVGSIIDELTSSDDPPIRAAEASSACPGSDCDSPGDVTQTRALVIVLAGLAIAFAGVLVIRARSRRSTTEVPSDRP